MSIHKAKEIINQGRGNILITGPAGSGKTYILQELVRFLVTTKKIRPERLLIFSFNRRWSKIIRQRTVVSLNMSIPEIPVETFYSFCMDILFNRQTTFSRDNHLPGHVSASSPGVFDDIQTKGSYPDLFEVKKIITSTEQWRLLKEILEGLKKNGFPISSRYAASAAPVFNSYIQEVFDFILRAQENLLTPEVLLDRLTPYTGKGLSEIAAVYGRYVKRLKNDRLYNYGMLLTDTVELLEKNESLRKFYKDRYDYIIFDELQEANRAQLEIIKNISTSNCIFFGNDDEAIYAFRGSKAGNIKKIFNEIDPDRVVMLKKNRRSTGLIDAICKGVIGLNKEHTEFPERKEDKEAWINDGCLNKMGRSGEGEVQVKDFYSAVEEAAYICRKIKSLYACRKVRLEDMAIIIKGLGYETHVIENALIREKIPYIRRSSRSLLDNYYVRYLLALLRIVSILGSGNNSSVENGSYKKEYGELEGLLEFILFAGNTGIDPVSYRIMTGQYNEPHAMDGMSTWQFLREYAGLNEAGGRKPERKFYGCREQDDAVKIIASIWSYAVDDHGDVYRLVSKMVRDPVIGILKEFNISGDNMAAGRNVPVNVGDYLRSIQNYCQGGNPPDLKSYLEFIGDIVENQFLEEMEESTRDFQEEGHINLISFHQCKGLEFEAVFIPFLNRGYLPAAFRQPQVYDLQLFDYLNGEKRLDLQGLREEHLDSETRLFYTGVSRARSYLYMTAGKFEDHSLFFDRVKEIKRVYEHITGSLRVTGANAGRSSRQWKDSIIEESNRPWLLKKKGMVAALKPVVEPGENRGKIRIIAGLLKSFYPPCNWWDILKFTENEKNPYTVFKTPFSVSELDTYRECPFKYKIKYYYGLDAPHNISTTLGIIYHRIMKSFFENAEKDYGWEVFVGIIDREFDEAFFEYDFLRQQLKEKAYGDFHNYYIRYLPSGLQDVEMEKMFCFNAGEDRVRGRIDQITVTGPDSVEIIDFKSGSKKYSKKDLEDELQLKAYRMAAEVSPELENYSGKDISLKYLCLGDHKNTLYCLPGDYYDRDGTGKKIKEIIKKIKNEQFRPSPGSRYSCFNCDYRMICPEYHG
ncbi:MAG: ATP-dependent helicase [Actinobacteria bacterium]|nr:ATP-dependent helicase [Actinomycetota bacterium]